MAAVLLLSLVAVLSCALDGAILARAAVVDPNIKVFNVLTFGAKPDGKKESTMAFMKAWNAACHYPGKARMVIPYGTFLVGQVIFQGPCAGPPPMVVQFQGTVKAVTDIDAYPSPEWFMFDTINGLLLTGGGTLDGQGGDDWKYNDCSQNNDCQLMPANVKFNGIQNGQIRRINSVNSKAFHFQINKCQNFGVRRLNVSAPETSPNTDGIHISESNSVRISNTVIGTGDDCISVGQGSTNITISRVRCGPGHGISIGSLGKYPDEKDVTGVIVRNCTLTNTDNGVRIKTWPGSPPSLAKGFLFEDIIMENVRNPIIINQQYCASSSCSTKEVTDVHFRDIRGTSASKVAVNIACSSALPCQNIELFNINLQSTTPNLLFQPSTCSNVKLGFSGIQIPPPCVVSKS
ncbi:hypothetical protein NE237_014119 [Protea cynaroides]|uniref:Exopolygalacturonase-like n=1 Tax=Protea cynaroides TaxID=273540 RepID=A0A9Q0GZX9_9MAGN|nr:hypothetical protein NE237_014119 [Protea cynaroides]